MLKTSQSTPPNRNAQKSTAERAHARSAVNSTMLYQKKYSAWEGPSRAATVVARIRSVSRASQDRRLKNYRESLPLTINGRAAKPT
jgi:hypothetical protein